MSDARRKLPERSIFIKQKYRYIAAATTALIAAATLRKCHRVRLGKSTICGRALGYVPTKSDLTGKRSRYSYGVAVQTRQTRLPGEFKSNVRLG